MHGIHGYKKVFSTLIPQQKSDKCTFTAKKVLYTLLMRKKFPLGIYGKDRQDRTPI